MESIKIVPRTLTLALELVVQLGQLLHAHRRARRGFGAVAVRPDAPDPYP